eukprot:30995-Pelagococcus_subviridis.AAC.7
MQHVAAVPANLFLQPEHLRLRDRVRHASQPVHLVPAAFQDLLHIRDANLQVVQDQLDLQHLVQLVPSLVHGLGVDGRVLLQGLVQVQQNLLEEDDVLGRLREHRADLRDAVRVLLVRRDARPRRLQHVVDDEQPVENVLHEHVAAPQRQERQHDALLHLRVRPHEHDPVRAGDDDVVLAEIVRLVRVADDLPDLVLERVLVQVSLRGLLRDDPVRDYHVHLGAVPGVPEEDHVEQIALVIRQERLHHARRVHVDVHEKPREVIERDVLQDSVHHALDHEPVHDRAVHARVYPEVLDLHDAVFLRVVHLRLEVREPRHVVIQDLHRRQPRRHLALRVRGVVVHLRGEVPALAPLVRPELQVQLHDLVRPERDPLPDQDRDVRQRDDLVQVVANRALLGRALGRAVRVAAHHRSADPSQRPREIRRHHVRHVLRVGDAALARERHRSKKEFVLLPYHLEELPVDDAQVVHELSLLVRQPLGYQLQPARGDLIRRHALVLFRAQPKPFHELPFHEVVEVVLALLGHVHIHARRLDDFRRGRVVVLEHVGDDALVQQHQHRELADPPLLLVHGLRAVRVFRDEARPSRRRTSSTADPIAAAAVAAASVVGFLLPGTTGVPAAAVAAAAASSPPPPSADLEGPPPRSASAAPRRLTRSATSRATRWTARRRGRRAPNRIPTRRSPRLDARARPRGARAPRRRRRS